MVSTIYSKNSHVCENLDINNIEIRTKNDRDVRPYVHEMKIHWKEVPLPKDFSYTIQTSDEGRLAFGIKGGFTFQKIDFLNLSIKGFNINNVYKKIIHT